MASHSDADTQVLSTSDVKSQVSETSQSFRIRPAKPEDNEALIALARRCPMKGQLEMYTDRYPDFFATNRIQGEVVHIVVAETTDGRIVGCGAFTEKNEVRDGKAIKVLHIGDMRADPTLRRGRVAARMIEVYLDMLRSDSYDHGIVEILGGNGAGRNLNSLLTEEFALHDEGRMLFYQLVPFRSYRLSKDYAYRQATKADIPEIVNLFKESYEGSPGAPEFSESWLEAELSVHPSFSLKDMWVATDARGRVVASMGLWDQSSIRRTVATKFTRGAKSVVRLLAMVGIIWKLPPLPREGSPLRYAFGRWPLAKEGQEEALGQLCRFLLNRLHKERTQQFLAIGFHEKDPLKRSLEGMTKVEEHIEIYTHWIKSKEQYGLSKSGQDGKRFVDLSLI